MKKLQCFLHYSARPSFNMALDDWIARHVNENPGALVASVYTWSKPAITFGYHQKSERAFDSTKLGDTPAIRRITGGRALLHDPSELTYAIGINLLGFEADSRFRTVTLASEFIANTLVAFLAELGRESQYLRTSSPLQSHAGSSQTAPCFASSARYEVVSGGKKLIASAQRRLPNGLFQHGAIKLGGLASHLAISGLTTDQNCEPIMHEQFSHLAKKLLSVWSSRFNCQIEIAELTPEAHDWIEERDKMIGIDAMSRREIFEQETSVTSL